MIMFTEYLEGRGIEYTRHNSTTVFVANRYLTMRRYRSVNREARKFGLNVRLVPRGYLYEDAAILRESEDA